MKISFLATVCLLVFTFPMVQPLDGQTTPSGSSENQRLQADRESVERAAVKWIKTRYGPESGFSFDPVYLPPADTNSAHRRSVQHAKDLLAESGLPKVNANETLQCHPSSCALQGIKRLMVLTSPVLLGDRAFVNFVLYLQDDVAGHNTPMARIRLMQINFARQSQGWQFVAESPTIDN